MIIGEAGHVATEAITRLIDDKLPPTPHPDRHWLFGMEGGPSTL
ncbi:hypothetical protein [Asanoa hainanensis]|nr:hypothetical protein [Asanoa hainanensis]